MIDRRHFLIGAGALLTASFVSRASAFSQKAGAPLILPSVRKPGNPPPRTAVKRRRASGGRTSSSKVGVCRAGSAASRRSWKECRRAKPADRCR